MRKTARCVEEEEKKWERWQRDRWQRNRVRAGEESEREEGLFVDHWQIMGSLGQT